MNPNTSQRIDTIYEQKSSIKKAKNSEVNALRHRLSDAKWRMNLNNGFNALKSIISPNGRINRKGKLIELSRIDILKSTIHFIEDKESVIKKLTNKRAVNSLDQIKNVFDLMERQSVEESKKAFSLKTNDMNNNINKAIDMNAMPLKDNLSDHKIDSLSINDKNIEMLAKNSSNDEPVCYMSPESINTYHCYQTYSVQMPEESHLFKAYFDRKIERSEYLTTDLVEFLSTNIPLTTMSSLTYLTDSSFDSSSGSHSDDCSYLLTPFNRILDSYESMNRKKKSLSFSTESRPISCRRKLDWSDSQWPGIMNLTIDKKASKDGLNVNEVKTQLNQQMVQIFQNQCKGDGMLSKDLESIKVEDLCICNLNIDQCLQSLNTKEDFQFKSLSTDGQHIDDNINDNQEIIDVIDCNQVFSQVIEDIDETKLLEFMNSTGKFRPIKSSKTIQSNCPQL